MDISRNTIIRFHHPDRKGTDERVLLIDFNNRTLFTIDVDINNNKAWFIERELESVVNGLKVGDAEIINHEPYDYLVIAEENIPRERILFRDRHFAIINEVFLLPNGDLKPEIFTKSSRGKLIREASKKFDIDENYIRRDLRHFLQRGMVQNALLPDWDNCGAKGTRRKNPKKIIGRPPSKVESSLNVRMSMNDNVDEQFERGTKLFLKEGISVHSAYESIMEEYYLERFYFEKGKRIVILRNPHPTERQYEHWLETKYKKDPETYLKNYYGSLNFLKNHRQMARDTRKDAGGPGRIVQYDPVLFKLNLVHPLDRNLIVGFAWAYLAMDQFSTAYVGVHTSFLRPFFGNGVATLVNVTSDKVDYCKDHNISISYEDWPMQFKPYSYLSDHGDLFNKVSITLSKSLGIQQSFAPRKRPDDKGLIEGGFHVIKSEKALMEISGYYPGLTVYENINPYYEGILTKYEFTQILILLLLKRNRSGLLTDFKRDKDMIQSKVPMFPNDIWTWGLEYRGRPDAIDPNLVRRTLLPRGKAKVNATNIKFNGRTYKSQVVRDLGLHTIARDRGVLDFDAAYDYNDPKVIYLILEDGHRFEPCYLDPEDNAFLNVSFYEQEFLRAKELASENERKEENLAKNVGTNKDIKDIVDQAKELTEKDRAGKSKSSRRKGSGEARKELEEQDRQEQAEKNRTSLGVTTTIRTEDHTPVIQNSSDYQGIPFEIEFMEKMDQEIAAND